MRILVISPQSPWPLDLGSKIRIYHTTNELAARHDTTLACLAHTSSDSNQKGHYRQPGWREHKVYVGAKSRRVVGVRSLFSTKPYRVVKFHSERFKKQLTELLAQNHYDILWVHFLNMLSHVPALGPGSPLVVLDQHNADELMWRGYAAEGNLAARLFAAQNLVKLRRFQRDVLSKVDVVLAPSQREATLMRQTVPWGCGVWCVPNGVDVESLQPDECRYETNIILFCGALDVSMNIDAVRRFAQAILPKVRRRVANAEFWVIGRNAGAGVKRLARLEGVRVIGRVEDVRCYYRKARVAVAPFRFGAGTKLKVLEAMAMGVPVVATEVGSQGLRAIPGREFILANDDDDVAAAVGELLTDTTRWNDLAVAGRRLVEGHYSWTGIVGETMLALEQLCATRQGY